MIAFKEVIKIKRWCEVTKSNTEIIKSKENLFLYKAFIDFNTKKMFAIVCFGYVIKICDTLKEANKSLEIAEKMNKVLNLTEVKKITHLRFEFDNPEKVDLNFVPIENWLSVENWREEKHKCCECKREYKELDLSYISIVTFKDTYNRHICRECGLKYIALGAENVTR